MLCYRLYSCAAVIVLLLFVFVSVIVCVVLCIEIVRTTALPPGVNPIAVVKYIYIVTGVGSFSPLLGVRKKLYIW